LKDDNFLFKRLDFKLPHARIEVRAPATDGYTADASKVEYRHVRMGFNRVKQALVRSQDGSLIIQS